MKISDEIVQLAAGAYRGGVTHESAIRCALSAVLPKLMVKVKQLEWTENNEPNENCSYDHTFSETAIGKYQIEWKSWKEFDAYVLYLSDDFVLSEYDLPSAKAAAQADYERRVRECIVEESNAQGWLYFNEDTGTEYSADHPVISGECPDAQDIKPATNENLLHELLSSWKAWAEDRQEIADLRAEIAVKPVDVAADELSGKYRQLKSVDVAAGCANTLSEKQHHIGYSIENECHFIRFYPFTSASEAAAAIEALSAVPDVPELVRYDPDIYRRRDETILCRMVDDTNGEYVRYDQVAAIVEEARLQQKAWADKWDYAISRAEAARTELTQIKTREPIDQTAEIKRLREALEFYADGINNRIARAALSGKEQS